MFFEICDIIPSAIYINDRESLDSVYVNHVVENLMELGRKDIINGGSSLLRSRSHLETFMHVYNRICRYEKIADPQSICSYFQCFNFQKEWHWLYTHKIILDKNTYLNISTKISDLGNIGIVLNDLLGGTIINREGWEKFCSLSKREKEILKKIAAGQSRRSIGDDLFISENTVRTHRKNIMAKIDARSIHDIIHFSQAFEFLGEL